MEKQVAQVQQGAAGSDNGDVVTHQLCGSGQEGRRARDPPGERPGESEMTLASTWDTAHVG